LKIARPLNIAMVVASPFPANHGTPGSIREMAQALADKGHAVHIVTYHFGEGQYPKGVNIHRIVNLGLKKKMVIGPTKGKPFLDFLLVYKLVRVILKEKIDLIHAHNYEGALVGYLARILTHRPMVYNAINTMSDELPSYNFFRPKILAIWLAGFLDFLVPRMADQIIAISEELVGFLKKQKIDGEKVHFIPLGIDTRPFEGLDRSTIRNRYSLGNVPLVIYTGTVDRFQRIDYLLKAMANVCKHIENAKLFIIVNIAVQKDLKDCHQIIENLNLQNNVVVLTNKPLEEVPHFLAGADVAVVARPDCPGFPVKLLNYMAAGKPIVLFEGTSKGLQHLKSAFIVKDHNWEEMAHGIISLLQNRSLCQDLGRNAKSRVKENFAWEKLSERVENVYYELLDI